VSLFRISLVVLGLGLASCSTTAPVKPHDGVAKRWGQFLSMPHQRAFALAGDPDGRWVGATVGGYRSPTEAEHEALRRCEHERSASRIEEPCQIYAVGHQIVWPGSSQP